MKSNLDVKNVTHYKTAPLETPQLTRLCSGALSAKKSPKGLQNRLRPDILRSEMNSELYSHCSYEGCEEPNTVAVWCQAHFELTRLKMQEEITAKVNAYGETK